MSDSQSSLDAFLSSGNNSLSSPKEEQKPEKATDTQENMSLEDEFSKLLNDFISQDMGQNNQQTSEPSLDNTITPNEKDQSEEQMSLDSMVNTMPTEENSGLDEFATENTNETDEYLNQEEYFGGLDELVTENPENENQENVDANGMKEEEQELSRAIENFQDGINAMAGKKNLKLPKFDYTKEMLIPNYKPSIGKKIAQYLIDCWTIINRYDPENMKKLSPTATDEDYLNFAESLTDTYLQLVIISYVEILMNMEICENTYQQRKEEMQKRRIKRELYEEYMELQERKQMFIEKLQEKNFPIDAKNLINNYFRAAQKDPDGSFEALVKNPAMFSPIQVEKIRPKFFGLIKVTPEDGIKTNQKIGKFVKNLKV